MTDEIVVDKAKKRVSRKREHTQIDIVDGQAVVNVVPEEFLEVEDPEVGLDSDVPRVKFNTPQGDAIYEFVGNCIDCGNKRPPIERPVFTCITGKVRADEQLGIQRAAFRRDGHSGSALCQECYNKWHDSLPKREAKFKVL